MIQDEHPVGSIVINTSYKVEEKIAHLSMLCVHSDFGGRGLGGILIKAAE